MESGCCGGNVKYRVDGYLSCDECNQKLNFLGIPIKESKMKELWERIKPSVKKFLLEALAGFIFWTVVLSPYMIFVVKTDFIQYWKWILMEIILIAPFAPFSIRFIRWFAKQFKRKVKRKKELTFP